MSPVIVGKTGALGQTEAKVGIMAGAGGTRRLIRVTCKSVASLMLMTGRTLTGERALCCGAEVLLDLEHREFMLFDT